MNFRALSKFQAQKAHFQRKRFLDVAREKALPFDPLVPNAETIAAMREARGGKLKTVTLSELQAVLDADGMPDPAQAERAQRVELLLVGAVA